MTATYRSIPQPYSRRVSGNSNPQPFTHSAGCQRRFSHWSATLPVLPLWSQFELGRRPGHDRRPQLRHQGLRQHPRRLRRPGLGRRPAGDRPADIAVSANPTTRCSRRTWRATMIPFTPATSPRPTRSSASASTTLMTQTFAHEGRMPPLVEDNRLRRPVSAPCPASYYAYPAFPNYTGNVGDDNPAWSAFAGSGIPGPPSTPRPRARA